jgi:hypothetical protein
MGVYYFYGLAGLELLGLRHAMNDYSRQDLDATKQKNCISDMMRYKNDVARVIVGRISWLRRARLERDGGLGLALFLAVCPLGGHMHANGLLWHAGMPVAGAACMGLTT